MLFFRTLYIHPNNIHIYDNHVYNKKLLLSFSCGSPLIWFIYNDKEGMLNDYYKKIKKYINVVKNIYGEENSKKWRVNDLDFLD